MIDVLISVAIILAMFLFYLWIFGAAIDTIRAAGRFLERITKVPEFKVTYRQTHETIVLADDADAAAEHVDAQDTDNFIFIENVEEIEQGE